MHGVAVAFARAAEGMFFVEVAALASFLSPRVIFAVLSLGALEGVCSERSTHVPFLLAVSVLVFSSSGWVVSSCYAITFLCDNSGRDDNLSSGNCSHSYVSCAGAWAQLGNTVVVSALAVPVALALAVTEGVLSAVNAFLYHILLIIADDLANCSRSENEAFSWLTYKLCFRKKSCSSEQ